MMVTSWLSAGKKGDTQRSRRSFQPLPPLAAICRNHQEVYLGYPYQLPLGFVPLQIKFSRAVAVIFKVYDELLVHTLPQNDGLEPHLLPPNSTLFLTTPPQRDQCGPTRRNARAFTLINIFFTVKNNADNIIVSHYCKCMIKFLSVGAFTHIFNVTQTHQ